MLGIHEKKNVLTTAVTIPGESDSLAALVSLSYKNATLLTDAEISVAVVTRQEGAQSECKLVSHVEAYFHVFTHKINDDSQRLKIINYPNFCLSASDIYDDNLFILCRSEVSFLNRGFSMLLDGCRCRAITHTHINTDTVLLSTCVDLLDTADDYSRLQSLLGDGGTAVLSPSLRNWLTDKSPVQT